MYRTKLRSVVERFVANCFTDLFPESPAELVDFGFTYADNRIELFGAYKQGVLRGLITADELNDAVGDGPKLTALVARVGYTKKVQTEYDFLSDCD